MAESLRRSARGPNPTPADLEESKEDAMNHLMSICLVTPADLEEYTVEQLKQRKADLRHMFSQYRNTVGSINRYLDLKVGENCHEKLQLKEELIFQIACISLSFC